MSRNKKEKLPCGYKECKRVKRLSGLCGCEGCLMLLIPKKI